MALNGYYSDYSEIESGVPQGSVLDHLFLLIHISDLERNIKSNIKFFAEETMPFSAVHNPVTLDNELNHDLEIVNGVYT